MLDVFAMTQPLVCTIRDQRRLKREFELLMADAASDPRQRAKELFERFSVVLECFHTSSKHST